MDIHGPFGRFDYKPGGIVSVYGQEMKKKGYFLLEVEVALFRVINEIRKMENENT